MAFPDLWTVDSQHMCLCRLTAQCEVDSSTVSNSTCMVKGTFVSLVSCIIRKDRFHGEGTYIHNASEHDRADSQSFIISVDERVLCTDQP